jgi:hypothetical protein
MKRFDILKPVENHPDYICCTDCWQRGIEWGGAGEQERIIALLNEMLADNWDWAEDCDCDGCIRINKMFALIKAES